MGNALRFSKKLKHTGRESYYYNAFVNDVIISTIRLDSKGWWYSWHNTMLSYSEEEKQGVRDFVSQLNKKGGFEDRHA